MKPGTIVRLPDGREGTVVYHGLDGYGIRWGRVAVDEGTILRGDGNTTMRDCPPDYPETLLPEAMLRNFPHPTLPCVGTEFTVVPQAEE